MRRLFLCFSFLTLAAAGAELRVGHASVKITPPPGMPMAGYYRIRLNEGVHDDLFAKALVLEKDGSKAALVALDLGSIPRRFVESARRIIEKDTGIRGERVMISATHTHTGPEMGSRLRNVPDAAMKTVQDYHDALPAKIAEAVLLAHASLAPARVRAGIGQEHTISFIRRFHMKDGTVGWNPGKLNPNIVAPTSTIDPDVSVVYFDTPDAKPLATYVNFANHLDTVGGLEFSADYPYTLAKILSEVRGPEMLTMFTIGCAGNINHIDVKTRRPQKGHDEAARIGTILAGAVLKTFRTLEDIEAGPVRVRRETIQAPIAPIQPGDLEKARKVVAAYGTPAAGPFYDQVYAFKVLDIESRQGKPIDIEVQVITLGNQIAWVGLPGEIFVELGKAIKAFSPFPFTIVAELANDSLGYVPDRKAYPEGAYEVINTRLAQGGGEMMVEAAVRLLIDAYNSKANF